MKTDRHPGWHRRRRFVPLLVAAGCVVFGCCSDKTKTDHGQDVSCFSDAEMEQQVQDLLGRMTLREKVDEMTAPSPSVQGFIQLAFLPHDIGANERLGIPALRLAGYFEMSALFWLNLQTRYDLEVHGDELADRLESEVKVFAIPV